MRSAARRGWLLAALLLASAVLPGCATVNTVTSTISAKITAVTQGPGQKKDPWENWNRKVFAFNESLDDNVLKPVATVYRDVVPSMVRAGVDNFFGNMVDAWSAVNHILQGKVQNGVEMGFRFLANSTFGIFGLLDPASDIGLERKSEDFGQTLGRWGFGSGPYIVLPLLGSTTIRDVVGMPMDLKFTPATLAKDSASKSTLWALQTVNTRANLLNASNMLDGIALDKYSFVRDAYLARRRSLIFDGEPPEQEEPPEDKK